MSLIVFPEALSTSVMVFLLMASAVTSMITATLGAGGGVLLLVLMASWLPPAAIIPVHGMIQLGSNSGRAILTRHHIDWKVIAAFAPRACWQGGRTGCLVAGRSAGSSVATEHCPVRALPVLAPPGCPRPLLARSACLSLLPLPVS